MFAIERRQAILDWLKTEKSATVKALSQKFFIGEATIRRDLEKLEKSGLISRTYGGAVLLEGQNAEVPLSVREYERKQEKGIISDLASELINSGDTLILDSSSTTIRMIPFLRIYTDLTIITNGAKTAVELAEETNFNIYCTGGRMRENSLSYIGESANAFFERFNADIVFFSCRALCMKKGITDSNEQEAKLRKLMIQSSSKSVLLCDHTKFDKASFCKIGDFDDIDVLITDEQPNKEWKCYLNDCDVELICKNDNGHHVL